MDTRDSTDSEGLGCHSAAAAAPYEEETPLLSDPEKKKRRVSFADELTSVRVFQRDDSGSDRTPPPIHNDDPKPNNRSPLVTEEDENGDGELRNLVLLNFPSPASDFGSASTSTSNNDYDGEDWFGQVSAGFVRGQQLSASAASEDDSNNYEATLDSTEFKLHFQNHNQSDSKENLETPSRSHLSLEWRTPSTGDLTGINSTGNLMRGVDKPTPAASVSGGKSSCGDMSLLDENTRIYDYGILSHTLAAKMDENRNILYGISVSDHVEIPKSSNFEGVNSGLKTYDELKRRQMGLKDMGGNELESTYPQDPPSEVVSDVNHKGNDEFSASIIDWIITGTAHSLPDDAAVQAHQTQNLSEATSPLNISAIDQNSAKAALKVVGGLTVEFGGGSESSDQPSVFGDGSESSGQPLRTPREKNLMHIMTQSDRRDAGNIEHTLTEGFLSNASCTPEIGFKTNQSSKPEGSTSLLSDKQRPIFHPSIVFSLSESPRLHVEGRTNGDSLNDTRCTPEGGFKTNQSSKSPIKGSIASLSAKRQKMFHSISITGLQPSSPLNNGSMDSLTISSMDCTSQQVNIGRALGVDGNFVKTTGDDSNTDPNKIHVNVSVAGPGEELVSGSQKKEKVGATAGMSMDAEGSSPLRTPRIIRNSREKKHIVYNGVLKDQIFTSVRKRTPTNLEKRLMEWLPEGPSTKETSISSEIIGGKEVPSSPNLLKSLSLQEPVNSRQKRRLERTNFMDKEDIATVRIQRSPKVAPGLEDLIFSSNRCLEKNSETKMDGDNALPRDWDQVNFEPSPVMPFYFAGGGLPTRVVELYFCTFNFRVYLICSKFSEAMKQQMLPLAENLNLRQVSDLEIILDRLEKANKYRLICNQIQSQDIHNHDVNLQQNRVAEARRLQEMLVYKQAKLQLLHLRQERLRNKYQVLHSGIQETELLSKSFANHCTPGARGVQLKDSNVTSVLVDQNSKSREEHLKVAAKRQELGSLTNEVKELSQSLIFSCKIKGEPSSTDVVLVKEQLKKNTAKRFLRQHLQLWEVVDLEKKNSQYNLMLNYLGFLHQRFTITVGPVSAIITTNKLIEANIKKSYPMINACIAFAYVFNAESSRNLGSSKNLALETQLTSLRLSNLLDVIEEAHMARIELSNLIKTSFNSPSADQLDLQLYFIDCKTGHIVTLTLDMACLKHGVYPMEILPSQVQSRSPASQLHFAEILSAVKALKADYCRILRLCKCVSQVLRA